jgi:hypothetical protein
MLKTLIKDCSVSALPPGLAIDKFICNAVIEWEFASVLTPEGGLKFYTFLCGVKFFLNIEYEGKPEQLVFSFDHTWRSEWDVKFNNPDMTFIPYICVVNFDDKTVQIF